MYLLIGIKRFEDLSFCTYDKKITKKDILKNRIIGRLLDDFSDVKGLFSVT